MLKWIVRGTTGVLALALLALLVGALYERHARAEVAARYPPAGRLIDIGGRRIQLDCRGTGTPVVVFEAGRDLRGSLSWYRVHDDIAAFTRACAYSRAGIMWSDPKSSRPTSKGAAADLHATLLNAGERGPYVLAGHSAGGPGILVYTKYYPAEVAGLVFVDASHPGQFERLEAAMKGWKRPALGTSARLMRAFGWAGAIRLSTPPPLPDDSEAMKIVDAFGPVSFIAATREIDEDAEWFGEAGTVETLGSRPTFVLSGMKPSPEMTGVSPELERQRLELWRVMQNELAALSTVSRHDEDFAANHYVQTSNPAHVVAAVKWVVEKVRETAPTP
jgi:pimeloyl-ACP methyl ester carboxylesterase